MEGAEEPLMKEGEEGRENNAWENKKEEFKGVVTPSKAVKIHLR